MSDPNLPLSAAYDLLPDPVACYQDGKLIYTNRAFQAALPRDTPALAAQSGSTAGWRFHSWTHGDLTVVRCFRPAGEPLVSDERIPLLTGRLRAYLTGATLAQEQLEERMNIFQENDLMPLFAQLNQNRLRCLRLLNSLELAALAPDVLPAGFTPTVTELNGLLRDTAEQLESLLPRLHWTLEVQDSGHSLYANCDDVLVQILLYHLVSNALQANPDRPGRLVLRLEQRGNQAILSILDDGVGMTPRQLAAAFDPACPRDTLADLQRGVGTGLIVCSRVARVHGGALLLSNRSPHGLRASLSLPLCKGSVGGVLATRRFLDSSNGVPLVLRELSTVLPPEYYCSIDL